MRRLLRLALLVAAALSSGRTPLAAQAGNTGDLLLVLLKSNASAVLLDPATGTTVAEMPTGIGPHEVVVSPDGRTAVVSDYGRETGGQTLTVLDLTTRRVARTVDLGEYRRPHGLAWIPGTSRVLVTCEANRVVLEVDAATGAIAERYPTDAAGTHMVVASRDGATAFTSNIGGGSVTRIDRTGRATRAVRTVRVGRGPEAIDLSPDGRELWVGDRGLNYVAILDATTLDSLAALPTGEFPNRAKFTPDGRRVLLSNARSGTIAVYDAMSRTRLDDIVIAYDATRAKDQMLGAQMGQSPVPLGILMHPSGRRAWVALAATDQIAELDLTTMRVTKYIATGREPDGMALVPARP